MDTMKFLATAGTVLTTALAVAQSEAFVNEWDQVSEATVVEKMLWNTPNETEGENANPMDTELGEDETDEIEEMILWDTALTSFE